MDAPHASILDRSKTVAAQAVLFGLALLGVGVLSACTESAVDDAIARSSAPILVPGEPWRSDFEFTAPPGSTDLYQLRWNFRPGVTDVVTGWQVAATSTHGSAAMAEGPDQQLVDEALRASRGEDCESVDAEHQLQLCHYPSEFARGGVNAYLVRLVENHILVVDYNNIGGDRTVFDPGSLEARYLRAEFEPVPIDGDIDDYLVYVY